MRTPLHALHTTAPSTKSLPHIGPAGSGHIASGDALPLGTAPRAEAATSVVIIERHSFLRKCIQSMLSHTAALTCVGVASVGEYLSRSSSPGDVVVLCAIGLQAKDAEFQLSLLMDANRSVPIVVISDIDDPALLVTVVDAGANGFLPADITVEVAAHALHLVAAGGRYFPADTLLSARQAIEATQASKTAVDLFTPRQVAVIDALRRGKANKVIAYELNVCESTVKVHVRNIMKKLKAKNRTEVAYLANDLLPERKPVSRGICGENYSS